MRHLILVLLIAGYTALAKGDLSQLECSKISQFSGMADNALSLPTDVAIDPQGHIYIVDSGNHRILVYKADGEYLFAIGSEGQGKGELSYPVGIATTNDGRVLVADRGNKRVLQFSSSGQFIKTLLDNTGESDYVPVDVAVDSSNQKIYVTVSSPLHQIFVLDNDGKILSKWGAPGSSVGEFRFPATIAVSEDDEIYIVDVLNTRVQVFSKTGEFLVTVGSWGVTQGQLFRPKGVALTARKQILVSDSYLGVVQVYNDDTRFKGVLSSGGKVAKFITPVGMAVDNQNRIFIAEEMANRVTVCQLADK